MVTNDFLPFAVGVAANVEAQAAYVADTSTLQSGFQSGVANSSKLNKVWRQSSIMAAVVAQFAADYSGNNSTDDGTTTTLEANLVAAIRSATKTSVILADTGAANAYAAANTPPLVAGTWGDGVVQQVKIAHANTGASTYAPDGLTAIPIYGLGLQPLQGGELFVGGTAVLMHATIAGVNGGNPICVLMECAGGAQQIAPGTQPGHAAQLSQIAAVKGAFKNLSASATGTNATVSVSADELVVENGSNLYLTLRSISLSINSAGSGANGLDTGALAASTWYSVWVIYNPTTQTTAGLLSLSSTAPTLPSGYTYATRTGWIRTDGTGSKYPLSFLQDGRDVWLKLAPGSNMTAYPIMASGAQGTVSSTTVTWVAVSITGFAPPTAAAIGVTLSCQGSTAGQAALVASNSACTGWQGASPAPLQTLVSSQDISSGMLPLEVTNIYYAAQAGQVNCTGWRDNL